MQGGGKDERFQMKYDEADLVWICGEGEGGME